MSAVQPLSGVDPAPLDMRTFMYSVVIPVFNSEPLVGTTIERTVSFFEAQKLDYELILVNDGSTDGSWEVLRSAVARFPHVRAINLLRNYGQHNANLCGLRAAKGDYVVTMDDDLQNPPEEIIHLIREAMTGPDAVFGKFRHKQASTRRNMGSKVIGLMNRRIFGQPPGLVVSNFRILRRDVVDRICASRSAYPYITGQALLYSSRRTNVEVEHAPRAVGKSTYNPIRIGRLVLRILFSYSLFPLRVSAAIGFFISLASFVTGGVFMLRRLMGDSQITGITTLIVLLSFLNGVIILMLSMLGEYVLRTLKQVTEIESFHVLEEIGWDA
ncbi:MAG TPA: glycosyltransferase family 2 protein [Acidimicrobiia bacterium]|nr:glycosyltransferase family 2 protein [Acidimicrobiia bacterium]